VLSIRARLIDELGFDPDEPVVSVRSKVIAGARPGAAPGALAGAIARALGTDSHIGQVSPTGLVGIAEVAASLEVAAVAPARRGAETVAVVRTATGRLYVLPDRCPHDGGPISDGYVDGEHVICARHGWEIEAGSGRCGRIHRSNIGSGECDGFLTQLDAVR
jgi:nitrite reductase/ring-hydroxylating ferredoxin subunit